MTSDRGRGIDYGGGVTNIDIETGIRYGVIATNRLGTWVWDTLETVYPEPQCEDCEIDLVDGEESDLSCPKCSREYSGDDFCYDEPIGHEYKGEGYEIWVDRDNDLWIYKSPYKVRAQFCSPCAPGACYLTNPTDEGEWAYCLGPDWFDSEYEPMPYTPTPVKQEISDDGESVDD